jgi:hypothetical protein
MYDRVAIQVEAQPAWKWQSTTRSIAGEPVAMAAGLSGYSARAPAHLLFLFAGSVERAARAREPGTGVHVGPGHTVPASKALSQEKRASRCEQPPGRATRSEEIASRHRNRGEHI